MNKVELAEKLEELKIEHVAKRKKVLQDFAFSNNPYEKGDIISDNFCIIKIEKIQFSKKIFTEESECVYSGLRLKKDLTSFKSGEKDVIYQSNVKSRLN